MQPAMPPPRSPSRNFRGPPDSTMASTMRGNATHVLKRSYSTPSVGGVASTSFLESQPLAPQMNEKKRNKLGYHRTSIACGHCRRRKIRCIISSEDQNRCVNCIRLKKECSFHPVDQQQPYDQKLPPQTPTGSSIATASSSPAISRGSSVDQGTQRQQYPAIPVAPVPSMGAPTPQSEYFPPDLEGSANPMPSGSSYGVGEQPSRSWVSTDTDPSAMSKPRGQNMWQQSYQGDVSMGLGGQISPYADPSTVPAAWATSNFGPGRNEMGWNGGMPPPPRSMSFSGEVLGSHHTPQYYPTPHQNPVYQRQPNQFSHIYATVPVSETDENIEQAIDPAIMGTNVPPTTPIAWQQQQQQQQQQQRQQHQQQHQQQHHQVQDTQVGGAYRGWEGYSGDDGARRM